MKVWPYKGRSFSLFCLLLCHQKLENFLTWRHSVKIQWVHSWTLNTVEENVTVQKVDILASVHLLDFDILFYIFWHSRVWGEVMWVTLLWPIIISFTISGRRPSIVGHQTKKCDRWLHKPAIIPKKNRHDPPKESKTKHNSYLYELSKIGELIIIIWEICLA